MAKIIFKESRWSLAELIPNEDFTNANEMFEKAELIIKQIELLRPKFCQSMPADLFCRIIGLFEEHELVLSRVSQFASLRAAENTKDSKASALEARAHTTGAEHENRTRWFALEFVRFPAADINRLIASVPKANYHLRRLVAVRDHLLSEQEEKIIATKDVNGTNALSTVYTMLTTGFSFVLKKKTVTQNELLTLVRSPNASMRKLAYETLLSKYKEQESSLGEIYRAITADWHKENVELRKYKTPISVRNVENDIPDEAIATLMQVAEKRQGVFQEYFKLKASLLHQKKLSRFDLYAPLIKDAKMGYSDACKLVLETFDEFSPVFGKCARTMFEQKHLHSINQHHKDQGAFCSSGVPQINPFVLLNYVNDSHSVSTLAHELGHGIHFTLAARKQSIFHAHAALPIAETASIFSELLLIEKLKREKPEVARSMLYSQLDNTYASIGRQLGFVGFEIKAHELMSKHGSTDDLKELYLEQLKRSFGSGVIVPDLFASEWSYIPHIFHTPFYCYAYGFGNLLSLATWKAYEREGKEVACRFTDMLASGGSQNPAKTVQMLGFDITDKRFWNDGFDAVQEMVREVKKE